MAEGSTTSPPSFDVEFQVDVQRDCFLEDCTEPSLSYELLGEFKDAIDDALSSGALSTAIEEAGTHKISPELQSVSVAPGQSPMVRFSVRVLESNEAVIPKAVASAGNQWRFVSGIAATFLISLLGVV